MSGNFGYMGRVTPGAILTKCGMWGDMVDIINCAIFGDCRLRGVSLVRGVILPSTVNTLLGASCDKFKDSQIWNKFRQYQINSRNLIIVNSENSICLSRAAR